MKLIRIYKRGKVLNDRLYEQLKVLDARVFYGCGNEFLNNRDWCNKIISGTYLDYYKLQYEK